MGRSAPTPSYEPPTAWPDGPVVPDDDHRPAGARQRGTPGAADRLDGTDGFRLPVDEVAALLDVDPAHGLTSEEAARRLAQVGPNRLVEPPRPSRWRRFIEQFRTVLNAILAVAAGLAALVGDFTDAVVVAVVLVANAILGYVQEGRAASAMDALRRMLHPVATVRRDGRSTEVDADDLVPGDVVLLDAGDRVPADGRVIDAVRLAVDESALTGESEPVEKTTAPIDTVDVSLGDRRNLAFLQTTVVRGRAELLVTRTGMATEMGKIAELLQAAEPGPTPLERRLDRLGARLAAVAGVAATLVFVLRLVQGSPFVEAMLGAVALAVAAVPEGLPAVVTVTLAVGVRQLAMRKAVVKRLASVETLGSTDVICSDKTGTLTLNQMTARRLVLPSARFRVTGEGYRTDEGGLELLEGATAGSPAVPVRVMAAAVLANDASVRDGSLMGDPTEGALVVLAAKAGVDPDAVRRDRPRLVEVPFDSATKYMATFHQAVPTDRDAATEVAGEEVDEQLLVCVKGAPDVLLARAAAGTDAAWWAGENERLAAEGLRVLALATRLVARAEVIDADGGVTDPERWIGELQIEALVGIVDPPRAEAADAIAVCQRAGIAVKMITGDHAVTAAAIAGQLGITGRAVTGTDLDRMSDDQLAAEVEAIGVFARVSPQHKVRVVDALQSRGHVVAMTGDGVNDAPALTRADIGVAMGITGTEVSKDAADLVLADDNFATIVGAVERGRAIFDNIVTFVRYQLTTNLGAIGTIVGASLLSLPAPLTAVQVLFVNLLADGPPAMTLGVDPPRPNVMDHPPRSRDEGILTRRHAGPLGLSAAVMTVGTLGVLVAFRPMVGDAVALTMAFTAFVLFQVANVFAARAGDGSLVSRHTLRNNKVWLAVLAVVAMQIAVVYVGWLQDIFTTTGLTAGQWGVCVAVALTLLVVHELRVLVTRVINRLRHPHPGAAPR